MKKEIKPLTLDEQYRVVDYFYSLSDELLLLMGADKSKFMTPSEWRELLRKEEALAIEEKNFYYVGWFYNDELIGHSNINSIVFAEQAVTHLHIWDSKQRESGLGTYLFKKSINHYFKKFKLKKIVCEPTAKNIGPNKVFEKLGVSPIKEYETTPGWINLKQVVKRYELTGPLA